MTPSETSIAEGLTAALAEMVYETTSLSPMEDDGSHWCKISAAALAKARAALRNAAPILSLAVRDTPLNEKPCVDHP